MSDLLRKEVEQILLNELNSAETTDLPLKRKEIAAWDSLKHLEIILTLEEEFNIQLTSEEVASIENSNDIIRIIEQKR
jgi:acyl carrier protein